MNDDILWCGTVFVITFIVGMCVVVIIVDGKINDHYLCLKILVSKMKTDNERINYNIDKRSMNFAFVHRKRHTDTLTRVRLHVHSLIEYFKFNHQWRKWNCQNDKLNIWIENIRKIDMHIFGWKFLLVFEENLWIAFGKVNDRKRCH